MSERTGRYALKHPIPIDDGGEAISDVTVRAMLAGDLRAMELVKGDTAQAITLVARLTGLTVKQADLLHVDDFNAIAEIINPEDAKA